MSESRTDMLSTSRLPVITPRPAFLIAAFASILPAAALCASGRYREAAAAAAAILSVAFILSARLSVESVLITWFATTPLAYFYIRFPVDKSIITYDRAVFALIVVMLLARLRRGAATAPGVSATRFEVAWAVLS
ncbi:MAG TPA: hypothetical protein VNI02_22175, partial [Blastocatellia bacterium]|nr:hypothetical protein [Blastocatellia bacterium]